MRASTLVFPGLKFVNISSNGKKFASDKVRRYEIQFATANVRNAKASYRIRFGHKFVTDKLVLEKVRKQEPIAKCLYGTRTDSQSPKSEFSWHSTHEASCSQLAELFRSSVIVPQGPSQGPIPRWTPPA